MSSCGLLKAVDMKLVYQTKEKSLCIHYVLLIIYQCDSACISMCEILIKTYPQALNLPTISGCVKFNPNLSSGKALNPFVTICSFDLRKKNQVTFVLICIFYSYNEMKFLQYTMKRAHSWPESYISSCNAAHLVPPASQFS